MRQWRNLIGAIVLATVITSCAKPPLIDGALKASRCDALLGEWQVIDSKDSNDVARVRCARAKSRDVAYQVWATKETGKGLEFSGLLKVYMIQGRTWLELSHPEQVDDGAALGILSFAGHDRANLQILSPAWLYDYATSHPEVLPYRNAKNSSFVKKGISLEIEITASPHRWASFLEKANLPEKAFMPFAFRRVQPSPSFPF